MLVLSCYCTNTNEVYITLLPLTQFRASSSALASTVRVLVLVLVLSHMVAANPMKDTAQQIRSKHLDTLDAHDEDADQTT